MSKITFEIARFRVGSEKQRAIGIYGTFTLNINTDEGTLVRLDEAKLMKKQGTEEFYIESPYTSVGEGENKKRYRYWRFFPDQADWSKQKAVVEQARKCFEQAEKEGGSNTGARSNNTSNTNNVKTNPVPQKTRNIF